MTIIERLEKAVRIAREFHQGGYITVDVAVGDLAALLECARVQHEWINRSRIYIGPETFTDYMKSRTKLKVAVVEAQKKVGLE